jgi:hypothetical protein
MFAEGARADWLNTIAAQIMDGGNSPPSLDRLMITVPPKILTRESDGHCTAAAAFGEKRRKDKEDGWKVIISEMVLVLREQGFVGGSEQGLTWIKPVDGKWTVDIPGARITIFGQRERRMSRDAAVVGERIETHDPDFSRVGVPSLFESGRGQPFTLQVIGARGGITEQKFELHPLALAIPPMTAIEREALRASIERDGVKVPIVVYQNKILDGRNRGYFASVFKKPVRIDEFKGTEIEARRLVWLLNLARRHLTSAQRYLVADNLFGEQAEKEAQIARIRKPVSVPVKIPEQKDDQIIPVFLSGKDRSREWDARAAKLATEAGIPNITPQGMREIRKIRDAPQTRAAIASGKIQTVAKAVKAARDEKGLPSVTTFEGSSVRSIGKHLWECIYHLKAVIGDIEMPAGGMPEKLSERLDQIEVLVPQARQALRDRKMIS